MCSLSPCGNHTALFQPNRAASAASLRTGGGGGGQVLRGPWPADSRGPRRSRTSAASRPCLAAQQAQRRTALGADGAPVDRDPRHKGVIARRVPFRPRLQLPACGARRGTGFGQVQA